MRTLIVLMVLFFSQPALAGDLLPEAEEKVEQLTALAQKHGIRFRVTCGYRSQEEQDRLYAQGRSAPGKRVTWTRRSRHTSGRAFDVVILKESGVTWNGQDYYPLGELGESIGLVWGGRWKVRDYCHFEVKT